MVGVAHLLWLGDTLGERRGIMVGDTRGDSRGEDLGLFPVSFGGDIVVQSYESVRRGQAFHLLITSDEGVAVHVEVASQGLRVA